MIVVSMLVISNELTSKLKAMASIKNFEELKVWSKAQDLAVDIYKQFAELRDYSFRDQIRRAAVSISNNIAEGFDRDTNKEFVRFLYIAKASAAEVKSMLYLAERLDYLNPVTANQLRQKTDEISKMTRGLIKSIT